jgi:hypothetical protein
LSTLEKALEELPMANSALRPGASLPELLAARARGASDGRLVLDVAGGLLVGAIALFWRPPAWVLIVSAALCFAAFGAWGIADRELHDRPEAAVMTSRRLLRVLRAVAVIVGTLATVTLLVAALGVLLGPLQS